MMINVMGSSLIIDINCTDKGDRVLLHRTCQY